MKWPLAGVALLFAAGIAAGHRVPLPFPLLLASLAASLLTTLRSDRLGPAALATSLILAGWTHLEGTLHPWSPIDLRHRPDLGEELAILRGTLESTPEPRHHAGAGRPYTNALVVLQVSGVRNVGDPEPAPVSGRVVVGSPFIPGPGFTTGAQVDLTGVLRRPRGPQAPGLFDYASHLRWRGIHFELRTQTPADWQFAPGASPPPPTLADRFQVWARQVLAHGLDPQAEEVGLLQAMTLGWKTGLTDELEEPFMRSGTLHVFAISGLHLALLAAIVEQSLGLLLLTRRAGGILVIVVCWLYTVATGLQPSAVRATLMTTCVVGGWMLARPSNVLNSLAGAAFAILVWDPCQLFQPGFQLSFAVVATLGLLAGPLHTRMSDWADPDPMLARRLVRPWRRTLAHAWANLATTLAVGIASWIGSAPLAATHFHLLSISGLLANLLVVPLGSAALAANLAALVSAPFSLAPVDLFNHAAWFFMHVMVRISRWAAEIPDTCWNVATPPTPATLAWYLLVLVAGLGGRSRPRFTTGTLALATLLAALAAHEFLTARSRLRLVVLPLSGGHAVWIQQPKGNHTLIDTGDIPSAERLVIPFLRAQGINRLDLLALSHGDVRHTGGAPLVADRFRPACLSLSPVPFRSTPHRNALRQIAAGPHPKPAPPPAPWRTLHPRPGDTYSRADDACLVLELHPPNGPRILLLADLDRLGQEHLLQRLPDLRADVVILGPPARGTPPIDTFLTRLQPRLIVVGDAAHPATARAKPAFRAALQRLAIPVLHTSDTGSLDLRWNSDGLQLFDATGRPLPWPTPTPTPPLIEDPE